MITAISLGIGFMIYIMFVLLTIETYSKRQAATELPPIVGFYLYYTLLAGYTISIVDDSLLTTFIQAGFIAIPGGLITYFYYTVKIKPKQKSIYF